MTTNTANINVTIPEGYRSISTIEELKDYFENEVIFIDCHGSKCRNDITDGNGIHCNACYNSDYIMQTLTEQITAGRPLFVLINNENHHEYEVINCSGDGCRHHAENGDGIHCESCYGEYDGWMTEK